MQEQVKFSVVDRSSLPVDLAFGGDWKYGPLFAAAVRLTEKEAIHVTPNGGGNAEALRIYAAVSYRFKKDSRFVGLKARQRAGQLWIYRGDA